MYDETISKQLAWHISEMLIEKRKRRQYQRITGMKTYNQYNM